MQPDVLERIEHLLAAARRLADPEAAFGRAARVRLAHSTGLSPEGIELGLSRCLEIAPSAAELGALASSVPRAPTAHVLLSASVFTAAHRAIALALCAAPRVMVRPSRREPALVEILLQAAPTLCERVSELSPKPGEHVFAYGTGATLSALRQTLPAGVVLHAHGPGFGVIVAELSSLKGATERATAAQSIALDVALFDQRGCLSPRVIVVQDDGSPVQPFTDALAQSLENLQRSLPLGRLSLAERADITRYRDTLAYTGRLRSAGSGWLGIATPNAPFFIAPVGRNLHILPVSDAAATVRAQARWITTYSVLGPASLHARVRAALPHARSAELGRMQCPAFDGPVDRRVRAEGEVLGS